MGGKHYFVWSLGSKSKREIFIYRTAKTMKINPSDQGNSGNFLVISQKDHNSIHHSSFLVRIMEVDKEQHEDILDYNIEDELDDGNQEYDSETEDGENKDIHYNSQSDLEEEIHKIVPTRSNRKKGMTRLLKLKIEYVNSGGKKNVTPQTQNGGIVRGWMTSCTVS
ncbi:unnamed protein product [Lactuca saligna]|uniref:Uncharacterized protein n=1 Tax=Lactuca saligna TaxID=75948 RepID=A0AA35Y2K1_LACSI|nr:unnamed protein product [Lactuca saligna]